MIPEQGGGGPIAALLAGRQLPPFARRRLMQQMTNAGPSPLQLQGGGNHMGWGFDPNALAGRSRANAAAMSAGNPFYGPKGFNTNQGLQTILSQGYQGGAFNPNGTGGALDALHRFFNMQGDQNVRQAQLGSRLYSPDDPYAQSYARMNAEQGARNQTMLGMGQAQAGFARQNQDFLQQLLMAYMQPTLQKKPKTNYAQIGGQVLGTAAGALLGPH